MKIDLICYLYNKKLDELDIPHEEDEARLRVDTCEIIAVREVKEDDLGQLSKTKCCIYLRSCDSFWVKKPYNEMVKLWENN